MLSQVLLQNIGPQNIQIKQFINQAQPSQIIQQYQPSISTNIFQQSQPLQQHQQLGNYKQDKSKNAQFQYSASNYSQIHNNTKSPAPSNYSYQLHQQPNLYQQQRPKNVGPSSNIYYFQQTQPPFQQYQIQQNIQRQDQQLQFKFKQQGYYQPIQDEQYQFHQQTALQKSQQSSQSKQQPQILKPTNQLLQKQNVDKLVDVRSAGLPVQSTPKKERKSQQSYANSQQKPQLIVQKDEVKLQDLEFKDQEGYTYKGQGKGQPAIREGFGVLKDQNDKEIYKGNWKNNQYDGQGKLINLQEEEIEGPFDYLNMNEINNGWQWYEGKFSQGKRHGTGILQLTNGEIFQGIFIEDVIDGEGIYTTTDQYNIKAVWNKGILNNYI